MAQAELSRSGSRTTQAPTVSLVDAVQGMTRAALTEGNVYAPTQNLPRDPLDLSPFGPLAPLFIQAINPPRTDTGRPEPRVWEYPQGFNLPGGGDRLIPWETLRAASTNVDVIRRCIEIRKDDVRALGTAWVVSEDAIKAAQQADPSKPRDDIEGELREKYSADIARLTEFWRKPWRTNGVRFGQWVAAVMEDHITLDAVAIYPVTTVGGDVLGFRVVDGSTIKLLIDDYGERPQPPYPAFQQSLYGFPRGEFIADVVLTEDGTEDTSTFFTASQLTYWRENFRTYTPYGLSAVEQALVSAALYLKRQGWMHAEYDEGSTPLTWLVPQGDKFVANQLSPIQRREYEQAINDDMEGQTGKRHRIKISYPGYTPEQMKSVDEQYKPDYDQHLIKMVIGHMGVTSDRFGMTETKGLGATGQHERQAEVQDDSGVNPDIAMLTDLIEELSRNYLNAPSELAFSFVKEKNEDAAAENDIVAAQLADGRITWNEARRKAGRPTYTFPEADMPAIVSPTGPVFIEGAQAHQVAMQGLAENPPAPGGPGAPGGAGGRPGPGGGSGAGGSRPKPTGPKPAGPIGKAAGDSPGAAAAELLAYRRWIVKQKDGVPRRPFRFEHAEPYDLAANGHELSGALQEFAGYEWRQDITKDWRSWNAQHPLHPRGPHGRFVSVGNLVDELQRANGALSDAHERMFDEAVRRHEAGRSMRVGEHPVVDELVRRGLLEEIPDDRKRRIGVSEAGRQHIMARMPDAYARAEAHKPPGEPEPVTDVPEAPTTLGGGTSADVQVITRPDGTKVVRKKITDDVDGWTPKEQADAEELGAKVAEALGIRAAKVRRIDDVTMEQDFMEGRPAHAVYGSQVSSEVMGSDEGIRLGLLDRITNNIDRNSGNWLVGEDGEIAAIDNGMMFTPRLFGQTPFARAHFDLDAPNALTPRDAATLRPRLEALRPEFERMGHADWHDKMMEEFDQVAGAASGDRDLYPAPSGIPRPPLKEAAHENALGQGPADRLRQAEIMYGSDRSKWPPREQREAARLERLAARGKLPAEHTPSGQPVDISGTVPDMTNTQDVTAPARRSAPAPDLSDAQWRNLTEVGARLERGESVEAGRLAIGRSGGRGLNAATLEALNRKGLLEIHRDPFGNERTYHLTDRGRVALAGRTNPGAGSDTAAESPSTPAALTAPQQGAPAPAMPARPVDQVVRARGGGPETHARALSEMQTREEVAAYLAGVKGKELDALARYYSVDGYPTVAERRRAIAQQIGDAIDPGLTPAQREILADLEGRRADAAFEAATAARPEPRDTTTQVVRDALDGMQTREEAQAYLEGLNLTRAQLADIVRAQGKKPGSLTKPQLTELASRGARMRGYQRTVDETMAQRSDVTSREESRLRRAGDAIERRASAKRSGTPAFAEPTPEQIRAANEEIAQVEADLAGRGHTPVPTADRVGIPDSLRHEPRHASGETSTAPQPNAHGTADIRTPEQRAASRARSKADRQVAAGQAAAGVGKRGESPARQARRERIEAQVNEQLDANPPEQIDFTPTRSGGPRRSRMTPTRLTAEQEEGIKRQQKTKLEQYRDESPVEEYNGGSMQWIGSLGGGQGGYFEVRASDGTALSNSPTRSQARDRIDEYHATRSVKPSMAEQVQQAETRQAAMDLARHRGENETRTPETVDWDIEAAGRLWDARHDVAARRALRERGEGITVESLRAEVTRQRVARRNLLARRISDMQENGEYDTPLGEAHQDEFDELEATIAHDMQRLPKRVQEEIRATPRRPEVAPVPAKPSMAEQARELQDAIDSDKRAHMQADIAEHERLTAQAEQLDTQINSAESDAERQELQVQRDRLDNQMAAIDRRVAQARKDLARKRR